MAYIISEEIKRKLHYTAFNVGVLEAIKSIVNQDDIVKVLDECIEMNEKIGDGYTLCKVDEICKKLEEQKENEHPLDYNVRSLYSKVIVMLREACE